MNLWRVAPVPTTPPNHTVGAPVPRTWGPGMEAPGGYRPTHHAISTCVVSPRFAKRLIFRSQGHLQIIPAPRRMMVSGETTCTFIHLGMPRPKMSGIWPAYTPI